MAEPETSDFCVRLLATLRADVADDLLALHHEEPLAFGALDARLDERGRKCLRSVCNYCRRWFAEGGPHPEVRERVRTHSIEDEALFSLRMAPRPDRYKTRVRIALPDWDADRVRHLRGLLIGAIDGLPMPAPSSKKTRSGPRLSLDARALAEAKRLQKAGDDWGPSVVAKSIGSARSSLLGKRKGEFRCPDFQAFWFEVQQERHRRRGELAERGRVAREE